MRFNNILGNPPFQDTSDTSKGRKLYLDITKKMLNLYTDNLIFLTPSTIAKDKLKRLSLKNINNLKSVDYSVNKFFNVGVHIIQFHIQKNYNNNVKIINSDNSIIYRRQNDTTVEQKDIIPMNLFNKIKSKGSKQKDKLFIGDNSSDNHRSTEKSTKYKYKVIINYLKNNIQYTYKKPKLYNKKKISIHMGRVYDINNCIISTDDYGQYQNMIDIHDYTDEEIQYLKSFLFNEITILICKRFREFYKTGFNNIIYFFTNDVQNKIYDNNDVIEHFNLTGEEVKYLYSTS